MTRYLLCAILLLAVGTNCAFAQNHKSEIRGRVVDQQTKKPLDFVSIALRKNNLVIARQLTNDSGWFSFRKIGPGSYNLYASYLGYENIQIQCIEAHRDEIRFVNFSMKRNEGRVLQECIVTYKRPMIDPAGSRGSVITSKELLRMPQRNINNISGTSSGTIHGSRAEGTAYYIDGIRVQGGAAIPGASVNQVQINPGNPSQVPVKSNVPNEEAYARISENPFKITLNEPLSTFSIDVDRASYAVVRRYLNDGVLPPPDAVRVEEMINYFSYAFRDSVLKDPFAVYSELASCPWNARNKLLMLNIHAPELNKEKAAPSNLVFLIDVSGSMSSPDKLPLLQQTFKLLIPSLRKQDRVAIVVYAGSSGTVLDATPGDQHRKIADAIDGLSAGGSTAGGEGIVLAYKIAQQNFISKGNNRVILATDGDFNVGVTDNAELEKLISEKKESGVFLSVLGFGAGNYKDNRMEMLADKGNGNYAYIDNILEGKKVFVKEFGGTLYTVAKDVKIQLEFNPYLVQSYKLIGYENRMLANEDFNNDKKDAGEMGAGHTVTALYEIVPQNGQVPQKLVDDLIYQLPSLSAQAKENNELLTLKIRYKNPKDSVSVKLQRPVFDNQVSYENASENMRFAVSVAAFGLKIRNSESVKNLSVDGIYKLAKKSRGRDEDGYRAEFCRMLETWEALARSSKDFQGNARHPYLNYCISVPAKAEFAPIYDINKKAGMSRQVESRFGEVPVIAGARPEGTAYYIDGVRIRSVEFELAEPINQRGGKFAGY